MVTGSTAGKTSVWAALTLVLGACSPSAPTPAASSPPTTPATSAAVATTAGPTTSVSASTVAPATLRSSEDAARIVVSALNTGDIEGALAAFAPDALWHGFLGPTRLNEVVPDELLAAAGPLGSTTGATFRDLWEANFEMTAAARTVWTIETCDAEGATAVCELHGVDALSTVSGVEQLAVFEVEAGELGLIDTFRFEIESVGEPTERFDDFRRWVLLERPDVALGLDPAATRTVVELLDRWVAEGSPMIEPPDADLDPVAVVEAYLTARNEQEWETHVRLLGGDALDNPFGSRDEFLATGTLDRRTVVQNCTVTPLGEQSFVACTVEVTDIITAAAGRTPSNPNATTFAVQMGRVVDLPEFLPSLFRAEEAIEQWAIANQPDRYAGACPSGIAGQDVITGHACAEFIAEFQELWNGAVSAVY